MVDRWCISGDIVLCHLCTMAKDDPQFNLRMPAELRRKLTSAAKDNDRSVTAEINARLEATFSTEQPGSEIAAVHEIINRAHFLLKILNS